MFYTTARVVILSASLLLCFASDLRAQSAPPHAAKAKRVGLAKWQPTPQEVNVPYWTLEPGWNTEVEIRNNLAERDLKVTPVLKLANGQEISLNEVRIASEQVLSIDLGSALAQVDPGLAGRAVAFGSAALRFNGLNAANLFAASLVQSKGHPIEFHFDGFGVDPTSGSGGLEGIWWLPTETSTDYLIISNPSPNVVKGNLNLTSPSGPPRQIPLSIEPDQMTRVDLRAALGASANGRMGGLTLSLPNKELLSSSEIVFDETTGLAAMMKLFVRDTEEKPGSHVLRAPMMALTQPDPALAFPEETTLVPRILLWNASLSRLPVSVDIDWRTDSASGRYVVPLVRLPSGQVQILNLSTFQNSGNIPAAARWSTITLGYTGRTADLVAVALSYDKTSRYGLQTPFTEGTSRLFKGSMWHVDASHNTLITTGNGGSESTMAEVTLFYNEGKSKYRIEKSLSPGEQLWLNLGELIRNQVPDSDGRTIPPSVMAGSYELRDIEHALAGLLYEGKLIIDKTYGHAAYGCGSCCGYYDIVLAPAPFSGVPDEYFGDVIDATEQCGGYIDDVTDGGYNWNSSNTAVATLTSPTLHTVAVGTATGSVQIQLQSIKMPACPQPIYNPTQQINVAKLSCTSTVTKGNSITCSVSGPSGTTVSGWTFVDGSNNTVTRTTNTTSLTWSGTMVTGGSVNVSARVPSGGTTPLSASITVHSRNWQTSPASPISVPNGTFATLPVPPQPTGLDSGLGESEENTGNNTGSSSTFVSDNGPNNGYGYYATQLTFTTSYEYEINPDLSNTGSTFYSKQCGNYNAQTNPNGYISGSNLLTQTNRHEWNSTTESHYAFYSNSISGANNPGVYVEARIAVPGTSQQSFDDATGAGLSTLYQNILTAFQVEPYPVNDDANGNFLGNINYAPYHSCS